MPSGDRPFQVLERINDNAYKIDLPGEYGVSATFNVADLSPFDFDEGLDSRTNPFEEEGNDATKDTIKPWSKDPLAFDGPMTRSRTKKFKQALNSYLEHILKLSNHENFKDDLDLKMVNLIALNEALKMLKSRIRQKLIFNKA